MTDAAATTAGQRTLILLTVSLCTMLYSLTVTIVNVTLPQLQGALSATPDQVSWVVTLNIVATAVATPATGWLVARYGQRNVMLWAVTGFTISSLLCATANSLAPLLIYRIGQGAFGAPLVPLAQAIIVATYPPEQRASAQGFFGMAVVIGPAIGPVYGGYLAEEYNWRWVFILILPLCIAALLGVFVFIKDRMERQPIKLDWTGFLSLSIAVTCLQLLMDRGERLDWFESAEIISLAMMMGLSFYIFIVHSFTHDKPFITPSLFLDRNFSIGLLLVFVYGMLNFTPIVLLPPLLQNLKGYPDSVIGFLLATRGAGLVIGFFLAGQMGKLDPRIGLVIGLGLVGVSGIQLISFDLNVDVTQLAWMGTIQGIGCGLMWVPLSVITFASLPPQRLPEASSIFHLLRNFGSSIFISLSVMAVIRTGKINYAQLTEHITPFNELFQFPTVMGSWNTESLNGLATLSKEIDRQAQMIGYSNAFWLYTVICFASIPFLFFVRIRNK